MKVLNSLAFASLSLVAISGVWADEPIQAQPQQAAQQPAQPPGQSSAASPQASWVESSRPRRLKLFNRHEQYQEQIIVQSPSSQPSAASSPAASASKRQPAAAEPAQVVVVNQPQPYVEAPRRGLLGRLFGGRSASVAPVYQQQQPVASSSQGQPLPSAK